MIDLQTEQPVSLANATGFPQLRRNGRRPHIASMYRWVNPPGCRGIVLETVVIAGARCTTSEAVDRWIVALTAQADGTPAEQVNQIRTPLRRQRDQERADASLAAAGW